MVMTPYIKVGSDCVYILGEGKGLIALGEMLILKGKLLNRLSCTFTDGVNPPIKIECIEDLS